MKERKKEKGEKKEECGRMCETGNDTFGLLGMKRLDNNTALLLK